MKKVIFYGNCQLGVLANVLMTNWMFKQEYTVDLVPFEFLESVDAPYNIFVSHCTKTHIRYIQNIVSQCDVFIYQHVDGEPARCNELSTEHLLTFVKGVSIKCPNIFLNQFQIGLREDFLFDDQNNVILPEFNYIHFYLYEQTKRCAKRSFDILKYEYSLECFNNLINCFEKNGKESLQNMLERDTNYEKLGHDNKSIKIQYGSFLKQNMFEHILGYTLNHPTLFYFDFLHKEILKILNLEESIISNVICWNKIICPKSDDFGPLEYRFICRHYPKLQSHEGYCPKHFLTLSFLTKQFQMFSEHYLKIKTKFEEKQLISLFEK